MIFEYSQYIINIQRFKNKIDFFLVVFLENFNLSSSSTPHTQLGWKSLKNTLLKRANCFVIQQSLWLKGNGKWKTSDIQLGSNKAA